MYHRLVKRSGTGRVPESDRSSSAASLNQIYVVTARAPGQLVDRACGVIFESAPLSLPVST